jgi:hypothetical protein
VQRRVAAGVQPSLGWQWNGARTHRSPGAAMTYWAGCKGSGTAATGFENKYYGGLDMDPNGYSIFGHLNAKGNEFAATEFENGNVDIYKYTSKALTWQFSFSAGSSTNESGGVAFAPRCCKK